VRSKFFNLDEEKQTRIINAGLKEFALNGYDGAKTDNIVQEAGISKGLLFHYFGTKKDFYLFLFEYTVDLCKNRYLDEINMDEDIFERLKQNTILKKKLMAQNPDLFNFLIGASAKGLNTLDKEVGPELAAKIEEFRKEAYVKMFSGLDFSRFKEEVDQQKAIELITWTIEGFQKKALAEHGDKKVDELDYNGFVNDLEEYFKLLRRSLYKDAFIPDHENS